MMTKQSYVGDKRYSEVIVARRSWSQIIERGEVLKIIDLYGSQAVDFLCYNNEDRSERYHMPNTIKRTNSISLKVGDTLYSDEGNKLMTIVEDTFNGHDTIGGCCGRGSNRMLYGVDGVDGCRENFLHELRKYDMGRRDIVPNVNWFMEFPAERGEHISAGRSVAGDVVALRADMDVLCVISNCPQIHNACNNGLPTDIKIEVARPL